MVRRSGRSAGRDAGRRAAPRPRVPGQRRAAAHSIRVRRAAAASSAWAPVAAAVWRSSSFCRAPAWRRSSLSSRSATSASSARSASCPSDISSITPGGPALAASSNSDWPMTVVPRDDLLHPLDEVTLVNPLGGVGAGLGGGDLRGLEHRVLDVAPAPGVGLGQRAKVDVVGQRRLPGVELHPPDPLPRRPRRASRRGCGCGCGARTRDRCWRRGWWRRSPRRERSPARAAAR